MPADMQKKVEENFNVDRPKTWNDKNQQSGLRAKVKLTFKNNWKFKSQEDTSRIQRNYLSKILDIEYWRKCYKMSLWADEGCRASEDIAPTFKMANAHVLPTTEEQ